ncbi:hypothetical protein DKT69_14555 [Micromonospora sicca]|uniref:Tetratricopeptide repeat protein n=1 Tax=Micromonospora sicca TaxID=2202420 RepID=A0A317DJE7_9ACTN|nr:hypothetical protein DKT69_14555 [Micromonospora sp. 4G51]
MVFGDSIQISHVGRDVTVSLDRPPYRVTPADSTPVALSVQKARLQPSRLLLARHQVVPFTGRKRTLDELAAWISGDEPVAGLLVHGAGGQGKTRLASRATVECMAAGWTVWQVAHTPTPVAGSASVSRVDLLGGAVLAVVDYADRWPVSALLALLTQLRDLHTRAGTRVRVLMLARSDGYWWPALADRADSDLGVDTDKLPLPPLATDSDDDRPTLFNMAAERFAAAMDIERTDWPVPDLTGAGFTQVLAVHMAALAAVDATRRGEAPPVRPDAVSAYLLRREQAYWRDLHIGPEALVASPPELMHRAVVTATLTGAQPRPAARHALRQAGFAADATTADRLIDDHTTCYPPIDIRTVFEPLHPDRLGEDLIALSTPGHGRGGVTNLERDWMPAAVTHLLTADGPEPPSWTATAITTLVETAHRWPHIAVDVLYPLIRRNPGLAIAAGGATLTRLADISDIDPAVLEALLPMLPANRHTDLDIAVAAITNHLTWHYLAHITDPADRAALHVNHAWRLTNAGQRIAALTPIEEATRIYRRLAEADLGDYLPNLAASLTNLGLLLSELGRRERALAPAEEATRIYRRLAEADPGAYLPDLAKSLNNLGLPLSELGRPEQALAAAEEATRIYRRLAEANPGDYLPDLAVSLSNLGAFLSDLGRREQALSPAEESIGIHRRLAEANPDAYLPDLALSLNNLGIRLSEVGRREQALVSTEEAVVIRRWLAEANPDAYLPDLAASLNNLGSRLSEVGRREQALAPAEEATRIYRRLGDANRDAYLPDLAASLNNFGIRLIEVGSLEKALALIEEAVALRRRLVEANRDTYLPALAKSLNNLGALLFQLGRREQALNPAVEATGICRRLAEANPDAYLPDLAMSLNNLGALLSELGRREQALAPAEEATRAYRRLAETNADAYLPNLARSLVAYAWVCVNVSANLPRALEAVTEAIEIYRPLAEQLPQMFAEHLFAAYQALTDVLHGLGLTDQAADVRQQLDQVVGNRPRTG